jgi:mono/diheme cytochrome c family protein
VRTALVLFLFGVLPAMAQQDGVAYFDQSVSPILRTNCIACHSEKNLTSGLSLETRESILRGGNRGAVVEIDKPGSSVLLQAMRHTGDLKMPPGRRLKDEQIAVIEKWVSMGLPVPESLAKSKRPGADHWAYQAPKRHPLPTVKDTKWARNTIDQFILARLEAANLKPSPEADRATLLRRVHLDLTGLPPTLSELTSFLNDKRPDAYERVVDTLLASPHYGERWGRHWLDLARYADTDGYTIDAPRDIWKYRDWVIDALNKDMPFDQFTIEQFAGDLLPNPTLDQLIATGFHRNTPTNYEGGIDFEQYRVEAVADRVATTGAVFLGLTVGCARCHDHKFDPISQREFYQLFAFLNNVDEVDKEADRKHFNKPFLEIGTDAEKATFAAWEKEVYEIEGAIRKREDMISGDGEADPELKALRKKLTAHRKSRPQLLRTMIMREIPQPRVSYIHLGGDFTRKGSTVQPGVLGVLHPLEKNSNRLDLARWLVDKRNPLTARVTVNRMWQKYFGRGIVDTENDFGTQGDKPTHPEVLDWLALEFMEKGWSRKAVHRLIVTSATYRQASLTRPDAASVDPDNKLLSRQNRLRLDAEIIRDSSLVASGLLTAAVGGPSVYPPIPAGANNVTQVKREWLTATGPDRYRRGLYTFFQRSAAHPSLLVFDAPDASVTCTRRVRSNTPLQALISLNDEAAIEFAEALSARILKEAPADDAARIRHAWLIALSREPRSEETDRLLRLVRARRDSKDDEPAVWTAVSRVLMNIDEFLTRQ